MRLACRREKGKRTWKHPRCEAVYGEGHRRELERYRSKEEEVSMARLWSGLFLELAGYRKRIGLEESGTCRRCGEEEEEVGHVRECMAGEQKKRMLGLTDLSDLCCRLREALMYWKCWRRVRLKP